MSPSDLWRASASAANAILFAIGAHTLDGRLGWWMAVFAISWALAAVYHASNAAADWIDSRGL